MHRSAEAGPTQSPVREKRVRPSKVGARAAVTPPFGGTVSEMTRPVGSRRKERPPFAARATEIRFSTALRTRWAGCW